MSARDDAMRTFRADGRDVIRCTPDYPKQGGRWTRFGSYETSYTARCVAEAMKDAYALGLRDGTKEDARQGWTYCHACGFSHGVTFAGCAAYGD